MPTLDFKGKSAVQYHHLAVPHHQLVPNKQNSLTNTVSLRDNLIIQGDNLLALKALLPTYAGKIKCIYIDPPYNTGNEGWVYNDKVNSPIIKDWIGQVVGKEGEDFTRHDKWLCMMMPRLKLLREFLCKDGIIFASIDYNESANLRLIMNEIFGINNFVGEIYWESKTKSQNTETSFNKLQPKAEMILVYSRDGRKRFNLLTNGSKQYDQEDDNGPFRLAQVEQMNREGVRGRNSMVYEIDGINPRPGKQWQLGKETINFYRSRDDLLIKDNIPTLKIRPVDEREEITLPFWGLFTKDIGTAESAKKELTEILPGHGFETVKPVDLIKRLIFHATNDQDIILDSFAGTGTTAQAVLELNKETGKKLKFILIQLDEFDAKIGKNINIARTTTAERVKRVINSVPAAKNPLVKAGLGGTFSYFELGEAIELKNLLAGKQLPTWLEMARYVFYTTTGEEFTDNNAKADKFFAGKTQSHAIYVFYKPDIKWLKDYKFTLKEAEDLRKNSGTSKHITVYAPAKYVDNNSLEELNMSFCQLPYEIYKLSGN